MARFGWPTATSADGDWTKILPPGQRHRAPRDPATGARGSMERQPGAPRECWPALGEVAAPTAVLVRPDGYAAWVGDLTQLGLADALTTWFGPPTAV